MVRFLALGFVVVMLSACAGGAGRYYDPNTADFAAYSPQDLARLEAAYERRPEDMEAALNYADGLYNLEYLRRAQIVLKPFINREDTSADLQILYAAIQLDLGNESEAEYFARQALEKQPENPYAHYYLALTHEARGNYPEAEKSLREALKNWQGPSNSILNDLALNLTNQGYLDDAHIILKQAREMDPSDANTLRNIRMVETLRETQKSKKRPDGENDPVSNKEPPIPDRKPEEDDLQNL